MSKQELSSFSVNHIDKENQAIEFEDKFLALVVTVKTMKKDIISVLITAPYEATVLYSDGSQQILEILTK